MPAPLAYGLRSTLAVIAITAQVACASPTAPTPPGYVGQWTGTTEHGTPLSFSVSAADRVTSMTLTYRFSAICSGTLTYADLAVPIDTQDPPGPPPFDQPGFIISSQADDFSWGTAVSGYFSPDRLSASGKFVLVTYGDCGTAVVGTWTARRR